MNGNVIIEAKDLQKHFGGHTIKAVDGVSTVIHEGEVVVVIGPSGSGKSTFLRCLNLMEQPTGGTILFKGQDLTDNKVNINLHRQKMGMVFQHFNLFPHMADSMKSWLEREPDYALELLKNVDLMLMNDEEAQFWAQTDDSLEAGEKLLAAGPRYAIVKHGSAGSTLFHRTPEGEIKLFRCPAWPLKHAQDPTGAGDAYMGALAGYLTKCLNGGNPRWEDMKRGVAIATVVAAAVCEKFGTISLFALGLHELARRIAAFQEMTNWE